MRTRLISFKLVIIVLLEFFIAGRAFAGLVTYSYSSKSLDWIYSLSVGHEQPEIKSQEDGEVSFKFSFSIDDALISNSLPTTFIINDSQINPDVLYRDPYTTFNFFHFTSGKLIVNPNKSIDYWDLFFTIYVNDKDYSADLNRMSNHMIYIKSRGGANTCNCDTFREKLNILTQRPYNTWIIASNGDSFYQRDTSFANWSYERISITEPGGLALIFLGTISLVAIRKIAQT